MLKNLTSRLPLPVTVLALGWVLLGNILKETIPLLSDICMIVAMLLLVATIFKLFLSPKDFYNGIKSPSGLSMFSSFSMSFMLISTWMKGFLGKANIYIWIIGVVLQVLIMIIFTIKYVLNFNIKYVFSSWFLVYSGMGIAAITCNDFGMIVFGRWVLKFTELISLVILPFILVRLKFRGSTDAAKPIFSLVSVPLGIILPAMIGINKNVSIDLVKFFFVIVQILLLWVLIDMSIRLLDGFYPSWSCYAASITISVYSTMFAKNYFELKNKYNAFMESLFYFECVLAFIVCALVLLAYFINTLEDPELHKKKIHNNKIKEEVNKKDSNKKIKEKNSANFEKEKNSRSKRNNDSEQKATSYNVEDLKDMTELID